MSKTIVDVNIFIIDTASCGHDLTKSDLPVDATSFCRTMFIDIADKQPNTAQSNAMLTP